MKFNSKLTTYENIMALLLDAKIPSDIHILEQTISHRHGAGELSFNQRGLLVDIATNCRAVLNRQR